MFNLVLVVGLMGFLEGFLLHFFDKYLLTSMVELDEHIFISFL